MTTEIISALKNNMSPIMATSTVQNALSAQAGYGKELLGTSQRCRECGTDARKDRVSGQHLLSYGMVLSDTVSFDTARQCAAWENARSAPALFLLLHEQPVLRKRGLFAGEQYPIAKRLARRGFNITSGMALTEEQIASIAAIVKEEIR